MKGMTKYFVEVENIGIDVCERKVDKMKKATVNFARDCLRKKDIYGDVKIHLKEIFSPIHWTTPSNHERMNKFD